jgi:hypothetical protein
MCIISKSTIFAIVLATVFVLPKDAAKEAKVESLRLAKAESGR